jgi:hypothetical protein
MLKRLKGAAVGCAALAIASTALYAAGNYSTYPIVGGASFCVSTVGVNGQAGNTGQGGGTAGTNGAYCAQTVPAGPSIVTGTELVPADTVGAGGASPQTVVIPMASLNALPITVATVITGATGNTLTAAATSGGYILHSSASVTSVVLNLPAAPIDGQQFAISADQLVTSLTVQTAATSTAGQTITKAPSIITPSTTGSYGYRWMFNAAANNWYRLL